MNDFLQETVEKLNSNEFMKLTIVLGNETCDLDSAVSALVYASFLQWQCNQLKINRRPRKYNNECRLKGDIFVPILNVDRYDFELKTEVIFCLEDIGLDTSLLIFRKDYNFKELIYTHKTKVILVDHHVLAKEDIFLSQYVSDIIDHRLYEKNAWHYKKNITKTVELVASCTTLITMRINDMSPRTGGFEAYFKYYPESAHLLYNTILLDTVNFSKQVAKATPLDGEAITLLERVLMLEYDERVRLYKFNRLVEARKDVSQFTASQLLRKDMKIVNNILVPSLPISVSEFLSKDKAKGALDQYLSSQKCTLVVLLGINMDNPTVTRDLAVYFLENHKINAIKLATLLETWTRPSFDLEHKDSNIEHCRYYRQNNIATSRKDVMIVINEYLNLNK